MDKNNRKQQTDVVFLGGTQDSDTKIPLHSLRSQPDFPSVEDDQIENMLDINDLIVKNPSSTFFVRVEGDSMEGAGIFSSDVLAVDRSIEPRDGFIIVAVVFGEMTVRRLKSRGQTHELVSENNEYEPIKLEQNDECFIWGVVVGSVRQFV